MSYPFPLYLTELDIAAGVYQFHLDREDGLETVPSDPDRQRVRAGADDVDRLPSEQDNLVLLEAVVIELFFRHFSRMFKKARRVCAYYDNVSVN